MLYVSFFYLNHVFFWLNITSTPYVYASHSMEKYFSNVQTCV